MKGRKPEIVAPAGDYEKLCFAFTYGADCVYAGGKEFSLRANAGNFSLEELKNGLDFAHSLNKKLYLAVNIFPRNRQIKELTAYLKAVGKMDLDALIISDPGVFALAKEYAGDIPIHISTQANNINLPSAKFWAGLGAKRIVLGRELSFEEIKEISLNAGLETEIFVHGAICISYSGRCLLSSFLNNRDANLGDCSHPCRWNYALREEKRLGEYFPIEEDDKGAYIFNSKDLCLLPFMKEIIASGAAALKIEGRNKSAYYVANIVRAYRLALDAAWEEGENYTLPDFLLEEVKKVSHRDYTSAFFFKPPKGGEYRYDDGNYIREYDFAGIVHGADGEFLTVEQRNHLKVGDEIEIITPKAEDISLKIRLILDDAGKSIEAANRPRQLIKIPCRDIPPLPAIIRRRQR